MEHEDNAQFDNFLQNTQHNLQHGNNNNNTVMGSNEGLGLDAGIGCGVGVVSGDINVGSVGGSGNAGGGVGKYEELDEHRDFADDNEWKYISEVHQSEKKTASNGNNNLNLQYNNDHDEHDDNDIDNDDDDEDADMPSMKYRKNNNTTPNGNGEHLNGGHTANNNNNNHHHELDDFDINKADIGDFSTTSNTISTAEGGDIADAQVDLLHVELNFDNQQQNQHHQQQEQLQQQQQQQHDLEEEDPSSNCTSSLSENVPLPNQQQQPQQQQQEQELLSTHIEQQSINFDLDGGICDDKENTDPFSVGVVQHPTELNFTDSHAFLLNPDAKEFVPSCSSNPTSPTTSEADHPVGEPVEPAEQQQLLLPQQQQLSALSRHLLLAGDDDFVARSPRKGREIDIDGLALPPSENDFEHEAAMRPHELEQEEDLIGDSSIIVATGANDLPVDVAEAATTTTTTITTNNNEEQIKQFNDGADFVLHDGENLQTPASYIDHNVDINMEAENITSEINNVNDVMKQSMYEESTAAELDEEQEADQIENILNSVQPLPTDIESLNNSFVGDVENMQGEKELLNDHDEKDHVSHPPSIEEMQFNLQNEFNESNKDIGQIPSDLDMNSAAHMQESFYMQENVVAEEQQQRQEHFSQDESSVPTSGYNESLLLETSIPFDNNTSLLSTANTNNNHEHIPDDNTQAAFDYNNSPTVTENQLLFNTDFTTAIKDRHYDEQQEFGIDTNASSPSPHSTVEEKHLLEETKEQMVSKVIDATQEFVVELEQKMENLLYSGLDDGNLKQVSIFYYPSYSSF